MMQIDPTRSRGSPSQTLHIDPTGSKRARDRLARQWPILAGTAKAAPAAGCPRKARALRARQEGVGEGGRHTVVGQSDALDALGPRLRRKRAPVLARAKKKSSDPIVGIPIGACKLGTRRDDAGSRGKLPQKLTSPTTLPSYGEQPTVHESGCRPFGTGEASKRPEAGQSDLTTATPGSCFGRQPMGG